MVVKNHKMKKDKIIYWVLTVLLSLSLALAGFMYLTAPVMAAGFTHLGFPSFFRIELGVAKIIGAIVLLLPMIPFRIKEWAYIGTAIVFVSAFIAHTSVDGIKTTTSAVIFIGIWAVAFIYFNKVSRS
jgi:hypothetical protein